jgi:hypothetical protein
VLLESGDGVLAARYHEWSAFDGSPQLAAKLYIE